MTNETKKAIVILFACLFLTLCDIGQNEVNILGTTDSTVTFQLGRFSCTAIEDSEISINANEFFSGIDSDKMRAAFVEAGFNPEAVPLSLQDFIVDTGKDLVLIDTGLGKPVYANEGKLIQSLGALGIAPEDVDLVIITHGHWDHIGGIADENGQLQFPNARHVMSKTAWDYWTSEENLAQMSESGRDWARENLPPLKDIVELVEGDTVVLPGFRVIAAPGHTVGQMAVLVESGKHKLLCLADAAHNPVQMIYPDIGYTGDMDREKAKATRQELVEKSIAGHYLVFCCHFPFPGLGYIEEIDGQRVWKELEGKEK
jgi:glyoxylase-like metal-dependent hydrolase (beta-lactamase superfamily II)